MLISASVRPRNLKRGTSDKAFAKACGFDDAVGLHQLVGRIELSGEGMMEFAFLRALYETFCPIHDKPSKISIEIDGKPLMTYTQPGSKA